MVADGARSGEERVLGGDETRITQGSNKEMTNDCGEQLANGCKQLASGWLASGRRAAGERLASGSDSYGGGGGLATVVRKVKVRQL